MDNVKAAAQAAVEAVADVARETVAAVSEKVAAANTAPLPEDRESLLVLHREARRRRDAAPLMSHSRAEAAYEIERIEIQIARIERAMDPPLV
jgi:uncharacterized protein YqeY